MKKTYTKPEIVFENFLMTTSIAAGCEITDPEDDKLYYPGLGHLFTTSCTFPQIPVNGTDVEYDGICYHTMTSNYNLFNS